MNGLIFTPDRNSHGKRDYTGAFKPKAKQFAAEHSIPEERIHAINVGRGMKKRKEEVLGILSAYGPHLKLDTVAFFCHGYPQGIQMGFSWRGKQKPSAAVDPLAKAIFRLTDRTDIRVPLYCCSTATSKKKKAVAGDGGFADELRDALCRAGATENRVFGHTTAGHTTNNPHARFFDGSGMPDGGTGGYWIARPGGALWREWKTYLRDGGWMHVPFQDLEEIRTELVGG